MEHVPYIQLENSQAYSCNIGSLRMYSPVIPLETILVEMHVPSTSFTRIHQSQAVHGDMGATISDFSKSWE